MSQNQNVTMYFDVTCPFAWVTSRWLKEVEKVREVKIEWAPMSLFVLNDGREGLEEEYQRMMIAARGPALVAAGLFTESPELVDSYYTVLGTKIHNEGNGHRQEADAYDQLIKDTLQEIGADPTLFEAAHKEDDEQGSYMSQLKSSHEKAISLVGDDVGTPVVQIGDNAFFGPVLTRIPEGEKAGELFDAAITLGSFPHFFELKRSRNESPKAEPASGTR